MIQVTATLKPRKDTVHFSDLKVGDFCLETTGSSHGKNVIMKINKRSGVVVDVLMSNGRVMGEEAPFNDTEPVILVTRDSNATYTVA